MISDDVIDRLLDMSRIDIEPENRSKFVEQLSGIIGYIDNIAKMDTSSVGDRESVFDEKDVMQDDIIQPGLSPSELRKYTKNYLDGYYAVPKILNK